MNDRHNVTVFMLRFSVLQFKSGISIQKEIKVDATPTFESEVIR